MKTVQSSAVFQPKQWAEKEAGKTIENRTQTELVPNQASKSNIVRGAHKNYIRMTNALKDIQGPMRDAKRVELSPKLLHELH